uniref:MoeA_N domain-containing protein n=1 Tax=Caenorhabditis tropicalis TaxID=1561998 RepID=A0A1I7U3Y9_9PELO
MKTFHVSEHQLLMDLPQKVTFGTKRKIVGLSTAVTPYYATLQLGECVRINNGGVVPDGADTVVPFKDVALNDEYNEEKCIEIESDLTEGCHIREKGSEAKAGDVLLKDGHNLDSISIGLLHALGVSQIEIYKRPRVCVMSIENGSNNDKVNGNFNRSQLMALFQIHGFKATDAGSSMNTVCDIEEKLKVAANFACVIVISGGEGHIQRTARKFKMIFVIENVSSHPGNFSFAYGNIDEKPVVLCMFPQDPRPSWIGANLFILPFLRAIEGRAIKTNMKWKSKLTKNIPSSDTTVLLRTRSEYLNGRLYSTPLTNEDFLGANSILEIPANCCLSAGDIVEVLIAEPL